MMGFGFIWMLVFWVLVIGLAILVVKGLFQTGSRTGSINRDSRSARDILDERYARGEITREQYQRIKEDLI